MNHLGPGDLYLARHSKSEYEADQRRLSNAGMHQLVTVFAGDVEFAAKTLGAFVENKVTRLGLLLTFLLLA